MKRRNAFRLISGALVAVASALLVLGSGTRPAEAQQPEGVHEGRVAPGPEFRAAFRRAEALRTAGKLRQALAAYRDLVDHHEREASAHAGLGIVLFQVGEPTEAAAELERAVELEPERMAHRYALAWGLERAGRREYAARVYLGILRHGPDPVAAQRYDALGVDVFGRAYRFQPEFEQPDQIPPWERSGLLLSLGSGNEYAGGLGGQLAYEWLHACSGFSLAPYASFGVWFGQRGMHARPAFAAGALGSYGGRNRWLLDAGYGSLGIEGVRIGGLAAAERIIYGASVQLGRQWMGPGGVFFRVLLGGGVTLDAYLPVQPVFALSLGVGWKP